MLSLLFAVAAAGADTILEALAGLPGAKRDLPEGLAATLPKRLEAFAGETVGGARSRGVTVGDVTVVLAGAWTTREACTTPWVFGAWRRVGDDWALVHGRYVAGTQAISCLFPDVTSACEVPWDGGLVCDIHLNPNCPEGARVVPFNCVPRCVDVRTCAYVSPLPFPSR